jgi:catechol 2,3-dioxygenase-like lactoylglutathione lyase family enzyme
LGQYRGAQGRAVAVIKMKNGRLSQSSPLNHYPFVQHLCVVLQKCAHVVFVASLFAPPYVVASFAETLPPAGLTIDSRNFSPIVQNLDATVAFYRDAFGLQAPVDNPEFASAPDLMAFMGTPGAQLRVATLSIPGVTMAIEAVEFRGIDRMPVRNRLQDPGAVRLVLLVRDIDKALARVRRTGAVVVTTGGVPVRLRGPDGGRAVVVVDPDGFFVEILQSTRDSNNRSPAMSNIVGARLGVTASSLADTSRIFGRILGLNLQKRGAFSQSSLRRLFGVQHTTVQSVSFQVPGSLTEFEFLQFGRAVRAPGSARIQDPGVARFQFRVADTDRAVATLREAGLKPVSSGGGAVDLRNRRVAIVRDPNNLYLVLEPISIRNDPTGK